MNLPNRHTAIGLLTAFAAGVFSHVAYQRLFPSVPGSAGSAHRPAGEESDEPSPVSPSYPVNYVPTSSRVKTEVAKASELPELSARDLEQIRNFVGREARIRGRVFRVGHSAKSNTYFINFGPAREALTAVIFASVVEQFEKKQQPPRSFEGKEIEITGRIKDHPQFGLEVILENPAQVKVLK